jgi:sulfotransferase family protein
MPELAVPLPVRRSELVSWPASSKGTYLVRDRRGGQTFQVGEPERFLLARLDGRHEAEQICSEFAQRFAQPFSNDDLAEFLSLAEDRGLLASEASPPVSQAADWLAEASGYAALGAGRSRMRSIAGRLLSVAAASLQATAGFLGTAASRVDWLRLKHVDYVPRPDDVFIVTYPRSGTTWMQMILYQLTSDGDMDFPHIAEYCPWFERSLRSARGFETRPSPRIFKSHLSYAKIPKGSGKYIYVARDGKDVAVSYYHLYRSYNAYEGTFAEFFDRFLRGRVDSGSWFDHVRGWWAHRHDDNVLFLTYEELSRDLESCLRKIAALIGVELPPERLPGILERCGFGFMKAHEHKFDPALELLWEQGVQLKSFLRQGKVGDGAMALSDEQRARFQRAFRDSLAAAGTPAELAGLTD